jgi:hypothetical protein
MPPRAALMMAPVFIRAIVATSIRPLVASTSLRSSSASNATWVALGVEVKLVDTDAPFVQQFQPRRCADHFAIDEDGGQDELGVGDHRKVFAPVRGLGEVDREAPGEF